MYAWFMRGGRECQLKNSSKLNEARLEDQRMQEDTVGILLNFISIRGNKSIAQILLENLS